MTIQNIEDVMDRIMSLNRNLTEDSLRTLLSASGWDKDDIVEGIRIFKMRGGSSQGFSPTTVAPAPNFIKAEPKPEVDYSFNIKKEEKTSETDQELEAKVKAEENQNQNTDTKINNQENSEEIKVITSSKVEESKKEEPTIPIIEKEIEETPKKSFSAKIFSFVLILILIVLALAYFFPALFGDFINSIFIKNNNQSHISNTIQNSQNINTVEATSNIVNPSSTVTKDINAFSNSSTSLENLLKEISSLRSELNSYKEANQSTKTIVKYISQKGATGKTGRGISSISGTSTGFVINYTDNTSIIIPYSTTTIINILNSNSVCFRDMASSSSQSVNDVCLDRDSVSKLIASSTNSH